LLSILLELSVSVGRTANSKLNSIRAVHNAVFENLTNCVDQTRWDKNAIYCIYNKLPFWEAGILPLNYSRSVCQFEYCRFSEFTPTGDLPSVGMQILKLSGDGAQQNAHV
jgi:hypothetical protein